MTIPEADLKTMAAIGAQTTSKETYATVKLALEANDTGYASKNYNVFLQGSYGNDTNIYRESDVDVVVCLDSIFTYDLTNLPPEQSQAFTAAHGAAKYTHTHFRDDVLAALYARFGNYVKPGAKAVLIEPLHNRRKADVLIATQHRRYSRYVSATDQSFVQGISFYKQDGNRVANYPKQHKANMITKNQSTNEWFKHIVRIFKNCRQKLVEQGVIDKVVGPSYYLEGLLYNVPVEMFGTSYENSMVKCINWLLAADRAKFVCANEQYNLLDDNSDVSWNSESCDKFLNGLVHLWNKW
jgi:hypothetical protein